MEKRRRQVPQNSRRRTDVKRLFRSEGAGFPGDTALPRTDLACEAGRPCVSEEREERDVGGRPVTVARSREADGGRFVTVSCGAITERGERDLPALGSLLAGELTALAEAMLGRHPDASCRILAVGLGNADMTPDAIGPGTVRRLTVTRHLKELNLGLYTALGCCELAALSPGVMGQTGMESGELVKCAVELISPHLVVAVDALAARSCDRLASTIQLSDRGIAPGSGIGNRRMAIDEAALGCPVLAMGVPTVVDSATLVWDTLEKAGMNAEALPEALTRILRKGRSFIVAPRDSDQMVELTCRLLARALDEAFGVGEL